MNSRGESNILRLLDGAGPVGEPMPQSFEEPAELGNIAVETGPERALLAFVFTDIVGSTEMAERLGDHAWCALLLRHHALVRTHIGRFGGKEIDTAGDGFFVVFDRPSRALQFLTVVRKILAEIGIHIRAGVHAGECEVAGPRVEGVAVHVAARVAGAAGSGDIMVSATVRELLAGSEFRFKGGDLHELKGLAEPRALFALESRAD